MTMPDPATKEKPVTFMDAGEVDLLRSYQNWLETNQYTRHLWCTGCREKVEVHVTPVDIGLICGCRVLLWKPSIH